MSELKEVNKEDFKEQWLGQLRTIAFLAGKEKAIKEIDEYRAFFADNAAEFKTYIEGLDVNDTEAAELERRMNLQDEVQTTRSLVTLLAMVGAAHQDLSDFYATNGNPSGALSEGKRAIVFKGKAKKEHAKNLAKLKALEAK